MGREANKAHGFPGEAEQAANADSQDDTGEAVQGKSNREDAIRKAAYEAYQRRGGLPGSEADDWLEAEAQVGRQRSD